MEKHSSPRNRRGRALTFFIATLAVFAVIGLGTWAWLGSSGGSTGDEPLHAKVTQATFEHTVVEQGEVESSQNVEIKSHVKSGNSSGMQILWVIPEGTVVEAEQDVVKLDSSAFEQQRDQQKIACNTALALKVQSENMHKAATIARTEYLEGTFTQEKLVIEGEIFVAEENLRRAENYLKYSQLLAFKGFLTPQQLQADRFAVEKAKADLKLANGKLNVLEVYTREKMLRTLDSDIATAKAKMESDDLSYKLEQKKLADLEEQIAECTIKAPQAGQIVYANVPNQRGGSAEFIVEAGSMVREGQTILRMPDSKNMQVRAKINETRITDIREGQPVTIKIDALGGKLLSGVVKKVSRFAEPASWSSSSVKQYATEITILDAPESIRTGLTADCTIHIERKPNSLQVPIQSVVEHQGKTYVLAQKGDGWEPQEIKIGSTNDSFVRIESGVTADQIVAANPRQHLNRFPFLKDGKLEPSRPEIMPGEVLASSIDPPKPEERGARGAGEGNRGGGGGGRGRGNFNPAQMFIQFDANKDGKLSTDEMPEQMRERMTDADTNNDGGIDQAELAAVFARGRSGNRGGGGGPGGPAAAAE